MINPAFACAIYALEDGTIRVFAPYSPTAGHLQRAAQERSKQRCYICIGAASSATTTAPIQNSELIT